MSDKPKPGEKRKHQSIIKRLRFRMFMLSGGILLLIIGTLFLITFSACACSRGMHLDITRTAIKNINMTYTAQFTETSAAMTITLTSEP